MSVFLLDGVSYAWEDIDVLRDVSLTVSAGERLALLGANGSGKSTLLRLLDALAFPRSGTIRFHGKPLTEAAFEADAFALDFRRRVGLVFQNPDVQLFNPTVFDEVAFGPLQLGWEPDAIRSRVAATLEQFGISHLSERSPHRLSGGEKKRVSLASVFVLQPDLLLLDEPTAALDPAGRNATIDAIHEYATAGHSIVLATHDLDVVEELTTRVIVLQNGAIVADGETESVLRDDALLRRAGLLHEHRHSHGGVVHSHPHRHHDHHH